ncbi:hypothetical protein FG386_003300 [Cryptosporidium ryanae]|uniref:uncharacterized protein n=1 Tax=Cryptosporidium ryanae TaxID=515981 RepID=UPI003519FD61|nr:hypothetical protein FG386_003300 [Cryptosporidium ryanae]
MRTAPLFSRLLLFFLFTIIYLKENGLTALRTGNEDAFLREEKTESSSVQENSAETDNDAKAEASKVSEVDAESHSSDESDLRKTEPDKDYKSEAIEAESESGKETKYKPEADAVADKNAPEETFDGSTRDNEQIEDINRSKIKEEDELHELKRLEEFKHDEMMEKGSTSHYDWIEGERPTGNVDYRGEEGENKYDVLSETIDDDKSKLNVNITGKNKYSIGVSSINQVVNTIIQPFSNEENQFQIEMKEEAESESDMDENKQTKSVIMTFDLSTDILSNKIPLISESDLVITRYTGITPQNIKVTILDPTVNLDNSQVRLADIPRFDTIEHELGEKAQSKPDTIPLGGISSQIPIILQQFNTSNFRIILEPVDTNTQFSILSNLDKVGPTLKIELKQTIESNSTWLYTITGVAIIFVIIGVSIALYFQNKNKESSQKAENMPLLGNKV